MAGKDLERLLSKAEKAYRNKDRRRGAQLVDKILSKDFNHSGAWTLLYSEYGRNQDFASFRLGFTKKYYPEQVVFLEEIPVQSAVISEKKPSFLARLKGSLKQSPAEEPNQAPQSDQIHNTAVSLQQIPPAGSGQQPTVEQPGNKGAGLGIDTRPNIPGPASPNHLSAGGSYGRPGHLQGTSPVSTPATQNQEAPSIHEKIRVVVVDDISETRENIIRSLLFNDSIEVVGTAANGFQAIEQAVKLKPDVILMDVNMPEMDGIAATAAIRQEVPTSQVIILTVQDDVDYMRNAMLAGARDFLTKPPMIDELASAVLRAGAVARQELKKSPQGHAGAGKSLLLDNKTRGKIISIYSPRGGAGCTTISANLAAVLHKEDTPVVIVDGNLQFGDLPVFFNTQGTHTVADLASQTSELDPDLVKQVLSTHDSGINILPPTRPEEAENIGGEQFQQIIQYLSLLYSYVLVDAPSHLSDTTLAALEASDLVVLLVTQDIPALARARKFLDLAPLINLDTQRILVALNQYDRRISITPEKMAETLKKEISAVIPLASEVVVPSINRGQPFMLQKQNLTQPIGRSILDLVEALRQQVTVLENQTADEGSKT